MKMAKLNIDRKAFTLDEKDAPQAIRNEWAGAWERESVQTAAQWICGRLKIEAQTLVTVDGLTITKQHGNGTIWADVVMRGGDVFAVMGFDLCAALMESDSALMTASIEIFKRA